MSAKIIIIGEVCNGMNKKNVKQTDIQIFLNTNNHHLSINYSINLFFKDFGIRERSISMN